MGICARADAMRTDGALDPPRRIYYGGSRDINSPAWRGITISIRYARAWIGVAAPQHKGLQATFKSIAKSRYGGIKDNVEVQSFPSDQRARARHDIFEKYHVAPRHNPRAPPSWSHPQCGRGRRVHQPHDLQCRPGRVRH
jgi:hypothetical protein